MGSCRPAARQRTAPLPSFRRGGCRTPPQSGPERAVRAARPRSPSPRHGPAARPVQRLVVPPAPGTGRGAARGRTPDSATDAGGAARRGARRATGSRRWRAVDPGRGPLPRSRTRTTGIDPARSPSPPGGRLRHTVVVRVELSELEDVVCFLPEARHSDDRGWFVRTLDVGVAEKAGVDVRNFLQDSQSRSRQGVVRGMHGRTGAGEAKLVRCARGAVLDILVDARPASTTFGRSVAFLLDDEEGRHLYVPPGFLHGFQVLTEWADVCYRIDREHDPTEDVAVRYDDPDLAIRWPAPVSVVSPRDAGAGSWRQLVDRLGARPMH